MSLNIFRLLLPASEIPLGSSVTKRTGEKRYTLRDILWLPNMGGESKKIVANDGSRFLVSENGDVNVVSGTTELLWWVEESLLISFVTGCESIKIKH